MSTAPNHIALCQAQDLPTADGVPDWIHLLPAGLTLNTSDGRGPYRVTSAEAVVANSGTKLPIDENHAIDLAAPRGEASPARGYIVELQARADGIWGRVDWTEAGRALMADRAYLGISPAIVHDAHGTVLAIARASLTNRPNLKGLTTLHNQETSMKLPAVAKALGLADDATEDQMVAAIGTLNQPKTALQSQLGQIGVALGVAEDAAPDAILAAAKATKSALPEEVVALQSQLAEVSGELKDLREAGQRSRAEAFVDAAIRDGRVGIKPVRERYITMHMADAKVTEELVNAMPKLTGDSGSSTVSLQADGGDLVSKARTYQAQQIAAGNNISWTAAVEAVAEGKQ